MADAAGGTWIATFALGRIAVETINRYDFVVKLSSAIGHVIVGVLTAEALVWCVLLPWMHHRYTTGVTTNLWKPALLLAILGASVGLGASWARAARKRS